MRARCPVTDLRHEGVHVSGERLAAQNGSLRDKETVFTFQLHAHKLRVSGLEGQLIESLVQIDFGHPVSGL